MPLEQLPLVLCRLLIRELWKYNGVEYIDDIIKIEVVATNDRATKKFFTDFKERLKESLRQIDILITTHGIQVI